MKNALSVFVFGEYERFLPYYVFSISYNYDNVDIVIFYKEKLDSKIRDYIDSFDNVVIYEDFNFNNNIKWLDDLKIKGGGVKTLLRFLIEGHYFEKYKYVYFGDVDVLIFNETKSLFDFHESQIKYNEVPFSNKVRLDEEGNLTKRLTGLHFVEVKPYFNKINLIINKIFSDETFRYYILKDVIRDEEFLFNLCKSAFNFDNKQLSRNKTPLHGVHLGLFRHKKFPKKSHLEKDSFNFKTSKSHLDLLNFEGNIDKLLMQFPNLEIFRCYRYFDSRLKVTTIFSLNFYFYSKKIARLNKKIKNKLQY